MQPIDPKVLIRVEGGACLINNGEALRPQQQFSFTYAYDSQFPFMFLSSRIVCPWNLASLYWMIVSGESLQE